MPNRKERRKLAKMQAEGWDPTPENLALMLAEHPLLKGCFAYDKFTGQLMLMRPLPTIEEGKKFKREQH